jgi:hypothetical protein
MQCRHVGQQDLQIQSIHVHSVLKIYTVYYISVFIPEQFKDGNLNHHEMTLSAINYSHSHYEHS